MFVVVNVDDVSDLPNILSMKDTSMLPANAKQLGITTFKSTEVAKKCNGEISLQSFNSFCCRLTWLVVYSVL